MPFRARYVFRASVGCEGGGADYMQMIPFLMEQYAKGLYPVDKLVSLYNFEEYQTAIDDTKRGVALKAVLVWKR